MRKASTNGCVRLPPINMTSVEGKYLLPVFFAVICYKCNQKEEYSGTSSNACQQHQSSDGIEPCWKTIESMLFKYLYDHFIGRLKSNGLPSLKFSKARL